VITCRDCVQALNPYIDRELSDAELAHVREHLELCGSCLHVFKFEESVRRLVRVRCQEQSAPESLRAKIQMSWATERVRFEQRRPPRPTT
jgi:mycothiol system anti-sigma-R factor